MCLIDTKKFRFTIFPKVIYKVVYVNAEGYFSPYRHAKVELQRMQYPLFKKLKPTIKFDIYQEPFYEFGLGFVFGYTDLKEALYRKERLESQDPKFKYVIIKGIIPSFTRYASETYYTLSEICARRIFWFKVI